MDVPAFLHSALANPMFTGMIGAAAVGAVLFQLKAIPLYLWTLFKRQFTISLTVYNEDRSFRDFAHWMARHPFGKTARRLNIVERYNESAEKWESELAPGPGLHLMWIGKRPFLVERDVEENKQSGASYELMRKETMRITTLGRRQQPIRDLLAQVQDVHTDRSTIPLFIWNGNGFVPVERRQKRGMDTVYLPQATKAKLIGTVENFMNGREWYTSRSIPYRLGISLEGEPGVGKSTVIFALASHFEKPVMIIQPSDVESDRDLHRALNAAGSGFVVIEDIDAVDITDERADQTVTEEMPPNKDGTRGAMVQRTKKTGITLSGLLNAIDGIASRDGRVLFITSNHADKLDAALMRPGRIDHRIHIDKSGLAEAITMFQRFYPKGDLHRFEAQVAPLLPIAPSRLQNLLLTGEEIA